MAIDVHFQHCITLDGLEIDIERRDVGDVGDWEFRSYKLRYEVGGVLYSYMHLARDDFEMLTGYVRDGEEYCVRIVAGITDCFIFTGGPPNAVERGVDRELIPGVPPYRCLGKLQVLLKEYMERERLYRGILEN